MSETTQPPEGQGATTSGQVTRTRASVQAAQQQARPASTSLPAEAPQLQPADLPHTPTLPQGYVSNYAEPVTNTPAGTPMRLAADPTVEQAEPAAAPWESMAAPTLEIAAPAPLPRPGDEQLIRGTAEGAVQQEELTGTKPEMPDDPNSPEAAQKQRDALEAEQKARMEAAKEIADRQRASQERVQKAADEQREREERERNG